MTHGMKVTRPKLLAGRLNLPCMLTLVVALEVFGGCASLKAYPDQSTDPSGELQVLGPFLQPEAIAKYNAESDSKRKRAWRNEVVNARIRADDVKFNQFQQRLFEEGIGRGIATDWIVLALNAAGSLASAAANALSATSAGVVGARAAFDKNVFFDKTMPALLSTMVARRKEVLVRIRQGLTRDVDVYPLSLALSDLDDYYQAGSIPGALTEIAETSGSVAKKADAELANLRTLDYREDKWGRALQKFWMPNWTPGATAPENFRTDPAHAKQLNEFLKENGLAGLPLQQFITGNNEMLARLRKEAVQKLHIPVE